MEHRLNTGSVRMVSPFTRIRQVDCLDINKKKKKKKSRNDVSTLPNTVARFLIHFYPSHDMATGGGRLSTSQEFVGSGFGGKRMSKEGCTTGSDKLNSFFIMVFYFNKGYELVS